MPHQTIEYVILLPMLLLQVFLFPMVASWLAATWVDSRQSLALQDVASHLGGAIQQLYFSLNHETISTGTTTYSPKLPASIEDNWYTGTANLKNVTSGPDSAKILELTITLAHTKIEVTTSVTLGSNALWQPSIFQSNSTTYASVSAIKNSTGIILTFGE